MSAFSMGARIGSRRPGPKRMLSSTVAASAMPCSTMEMASRHSACCRRLATNPGTSFLQSMGCLPTRRSRSMVRSTTAGSTCSVRTTSTSGIRYGGFQKCVPTTRSLCARLLGDLRDAHDRRVGAEDRLRRAGGVEPLEHVLLERRGPRTRTPRPRRRRSHGVGQVGGGADPADGVLDVVGREQTVLGQERQVRARARRGRAPAPRRTTSWSATSCPAAAKTWATPRPSCRAPMTATRSCVPRRPTRCPARCLPAAAIHAPPRGRRSAGRAAAVDGHDLAGDEVGGGGGEVRRRRR